MTRNGFKVHPAQICPVRKRPVFSLIAVCTIDGRIARHARHMTGWSSKEDKDFLHKTLDRSDAVVVGRNTYEVAKAPLSRRNCIVFTHNVTGAVEIGAGPAYLNPVEVSIRDYCTSHGYKKIAVLGGTKTFTYFLQAGLADEIFLTIEPLVFGAGLPLFDGVVKGGGARGLGFNLVSLKKLNKYGTVLLHYKKHSGD